MRRARRGAVAKLAVAAIACVAGARAEAQTESGVPQAVKLSVTARIRGEAEQFSRLSDLAVSGRGILAVAQPQDGEVRLFGRGGQPLARLGRRGGGPGEFRGMQPLGWIGDTLWVADYQQFRLSFFGADGKLMRTVTLPARLDASRAPALEGAFTPSVQGVRPDGSLLMSVSKRGSPMAGMPADVAYVDRWYVLASSEGKLLRVLSQAPRDDCSRRAPTSVLILPYCPRPLNGAAADGGTIAHVTSTVEGNGSGTYTLRIIHTGGGAVRTFRRQAVLVRIGRAERDSAIVGLAREGSPALKRLSRGYQVPDDFPAVQSLELSANGDVWVGLWAGQEAATREWHVYSGNQSAPRVVLLPRDASPYGPSVEGIWAKERDEDGVEHLAFFRLP